MPVYRIEFTRSSKAEFEKLPQKVQDRVLEALTFLSQNPFSDMLRIKKLKGVENLYRIRIGDYRILYEVRSDVLVVLIIKIGHRREVYRYL